MSSPSSSSVAETILPTPDQPVSSRRGSLISPIVVDPNDDMPSPYSPVDTQSAEESFTSIPPPSDRKPYTPSKDEWQSRYSSSVSNRPKSASVGRAPPPPPIVLRRPADSGSTSVEDIPLRTGSSASTEPPSPGRRNGGLAAARGLNIAGLPPTLGGSVESGEEEDALHALPALPGPSPRRAFFNGADINGAPKSPVWQSFEVSPIAGSPASPASPSRGRDSADITFSALGSNGTSANLLPNGETKFDPTPQHGIHARNMSLFFPSPGQTQQERLIVPPTPNFASPEEASTSVMQAGSSKKPFNGAGDWSFGRAAGEDALATPETTKSKRRGHHHKHSLSHNFFSFLDPTQTNPALRSPSPAAHSPRAVDTPQPVPMPMLSTPSLLPVSPTLLPLPPSKNNPRRQLLMSFSLMECLIGAGLWIEGQMSGWRCLAGVGYLVVFDAIGVGVGMFEQGNEGWRSVRRPYGVTRLTALLHFTQSLFLVFAAVYIAKESIESMVLGAGAHDHGSGGGHGHGQMMLEGDERPFPHFLLLTATLTSVFAGSYLRNHQKLVEAVGPLFLPYRYMNSSFVRQGLAVFGNPFSVTTAGMCAGVLLGSIIVPPGSLHTLDSSFSLLMTVLTIALSYPPTIAFGHVLLQTAPPVTSTQMNALRKALKDIEDDRRVLGMGTMRCWTIGAGHAPPQTENRWSFSTPTHSRNPSTADPGTPELPASPTGPTFGHTMANESPESPTRARSSFPVRQSSTGLGFGSIGGLSSIRPDEPYTPVVVNLTVHVHPDVSDRDVLEVTKLAWSKVDGAVGRKGRGARGAMGEVTIGVKHGWEGQVEMPVG